jgi:formate/nitrite transporter FocA (FNT family)
MFDPERGIDAGHAFGLAGLLLGALADHHALAQGDQLRGGSVFAFALFVAVAAGGEGEKKQRCQ